MSLDLGKGLWHCHACSIGGSVFDLIMRQRNCDFREALLYVAEWAGVKDVRKRASKSSAPAGKIVATYDYNDAKGDLLFQAVRFDPKDFCLRRPDGMGGWIWNLGKVNPILYQLPLVLRAVADGLPIYVVEGEKDADRMNAEAGDGTARFAATTSPMGAGKWRTEYAQILRGADVRIVQDKDDESSRFAGQRHARDIATSLRGIARSVRILEAAEGKDVSDHLEAGHDVDELVDVTPKPTTLEGMIGIIRRWIYLPDPDPLLVVLATYVANRLPGESLWLMLVGPSGSGKTEFLVALVGLPYVFIISTLTDAALLSGTSKKDKGGGAKGGLLREIGEQGFLVLKDFTSILSLHRDARANVLAALREVYDGRYCRAVGTDGGQSLAWQGKVGLLAACTPTIDNFHSVVQTMGERFLFYRLAAAEVSPLVKKALGHAGRERGMRAELGEAARNLWDSITVPSELPELTDGEQDRLVALAQFVAQSRAPVERDARTREIEQLPGAEAPTRIALELDRLLRGLRVIGADEPTCWRILGHVARSSVPAIRLSVLDALADGKVHSTGEISTALRLPTTTARRSLEDLTAYQLVDRLEKEVEKARDLWQESDLARALRQAAFPVPEEPENPQEQDQPVPEKSADPVSPPPSLINTEHTFDDFSGKATEVVP